jgi:glycosyltransferase involved in cell wall biosynthesis
MRIALIGPYPDYGGNIGGISMHIKRIRAHLLARGHRPVVYTTCGRGCPNEGIYKIASAFDTPWVQVKESDCLTHLHMTCWKVWALSAVCRPIRRAPLLLTVHGEGLRQDWDRAGKITRLAIRGTLLAYDRIIAVGDHVADSVRYVLGPRARVVTIPAFVPPVPSEADRQAMPDGFRRFVASHRPIIGMNGWLNWHEGQDLYGFDTMIEALAILRRSHPELGVVASICGIGPNARDLWERTRALSRQAGVDEHVCWITEKCEFYPVLEKSDVMIRPTRTDGWPLSIGEALHFGVPVVASDVCRRPDGVAVFKTGNANDLAEKVDQALSQGPSGISVRLNYHEQLMDLYESLNV